MEIVLSKFGKVIATNEQCDSIYSAIKNALSTNAIININAEDITIATKAARLIFGKLYRELNEKFLERIKFFNESPLFTFSVNEGISAEMESN